VKTFTIAMTNLRRLFRWRASVFFVVVLPMLLILLLGASFGGAFTPVVGVAGATGGPLAGELTSTLDSADDVDVERFANAQDLTRAVERGQIQAGLVVPDGYDAALREGRTAQLRYLARLDGVGQELRATVQSAVAAQAATIRAARFAEGEGFGTFDRTLPLARASAGLVPGIGVETVSADPSAVNAPGRFDEGASSQLLLFVFLNSLSGAAALIETRKLGVSRRMLSTPTPVGTILLGEGLGRYAIALLQGLVIMVGSLLIFGVSWGAPLGAAAVLVLFCAVGCGAGMLMGALFRNEQQAGAVSLLAGLGLAAIGGSMVPLEVFPDAMRTVAHLTPHAWGNDAFATLVGRNGGIGDIVTELAALAGFAVALIALATWRLRHVLVR
jgi:ABC-2 type transport system permease protein